MLPGALSWLFLYTLEMFGMKIKTIGWLSFVWINHHLLIHATVLFILFLAGREHEDVFQNSHACGGC